MKITIDLFQGPKTNIQYKSSISESSQTIDIEVNVYGVDIWKMSLQIISICVHLCISHGHIWCHSCLSYSTQVYLETYHHEFRAFEPAFDRFSCVQHALASVKHSPTLNLNDFHLLIQALATVCVRDLMKPDSERFSAVTLTSIQSNTVSLGADSISNNLFSVSLMSSDEVWREAVDVELCVGNVYSKLCSKGINISHETP